MRRLCIFDFDGTLANTLFSIAYFGNQSLQQHGLEPLAVEDYRWMVGNGAVVLLHRMVKASAGKAPEELVRQVKETYDGLYDSAPSHMVEPYEGIPHVLEELKRQGWLLGINSNKPDHLTKSIAHTVFAGQEFDFILGQREDIPKKPAPDGAQRIMEALGVQPQGSFYIGDSGVDIQTGKSAGLATIGAAWGFRGYEELMQAGADMIAETPADILRLVGSR